MTTGEERRKILEMVAAGKISAAEAAELLNVGAEPLSETGAASESSPGGSDVAEAQEPPSPAETAAPSSSAKEPEMEMAGKGPTGTSPSPRWLRIRVNDLESGRSKVRVNVPLGFMKLGLQIGGSFAPELQNLDWEEFATSLAKTGGGMLVEVEDEEDGEHVQIYVE